MQEANDENVQGQKQRVEDDALRVFGLRSVLGADCHKLPSL